MAAKLPFAVAHGVSRAQGDSIGAWWDERKGFIQPSEFILNASGKVMHSTYSSSPLGRTDPAEALLLMGWLAARKP